MSAPVEPGGQLRPLVPGLIARCQDRRRIATEVERTTAIATRSRGPTGYRTARTSRDPRVGATDDAMRASGQSTIHVLPTVKSCMIVAAVVSPVIGSAVAYPRNTGR